MRLKSEPPMAARPEPDICGVPAGVGEPLDSQQVDCSPTCVCVAPRFSRMIGARAAGVNTAIWQDIHDSQTKWNARWCGAPNVHGRKVLCA